ncbi:MAG: hypothetical protein M1546_06655, partial [Chloroflexi bacterium]|nr:hypothetical protein [Chloroflexota bacterium]
MSRVACCLAAVQVDWMSECETNVSRSLALTAVALSSASGLAFEIALTRVFAITQFYHFAFMTVSLALLGFGASGAVLAAIPRLAQGGPQRLAWLAICQSITTIGAYGITNALPFDSFSIAWDTRQMIYLAVYYLALAVPFFFGGAIAAALLSSGAWPAHHVYAANLAGSGAGCLLALAGLAWLGGTGVIVAAALLAMLAAIGFAWTTTRNPPLSPLAKGGLRAISPLLTKGGLRAISSLLGKGGLRAIFPPLSKGGLGGVSAFRAGVIGLAVALLVAMLHPPDALALRLSPYKDLSAALRFP